MRLSKLLAMCLLLCVPAVAQRYINVQWQESASVSYFKVKRSTTSGTGYAVLAMTTLASFDDNTVTAVGVPYYYVVSAVDDVGNESANSTQATAMLAPGPNPPQTVTAQLVPGSRNVQVQWLAPVPLVGERIVKYKVYRNKCTGSFTLRASTTGTVLMWTDQKTVTGPACYMAVAVDSSKINSAVSNTTAPVQVP